MPELFPSFKKIEKGCALNILSTSTKLPVYTQKLT